MSLKLGVCDFNPQTPHPKVTGVGGCKNWQATMTTEELKKLTPEQKCIRIAEIHKPREYPRGTGCVFKGEPIWLINGTHPVTCARYTDDLNAMHEAEEVLPDWIAYVKNLHRITAGRGELSSAAQRADAFLLTLS